MQHSKSKFRWQTDKQFIKCVSGNSLLFSDTLHHWKNAVLRLPHLTDEAVKRWLEQSFLLAEKKQGFLKLSVDEKVNALQKGWETLYPASVVKQNKNINAKAYVGSCGHKADCLFANSVDSSPVYAVAGCSSCKYGWLIFNKKPEIVPKSTVEYEQEYFEGGKDGLGYGHYLEQEKWRLEKAYRQIRQIKSAGEFLGLNLNKGTRLLDVGSSYGFLRKAAQDAGWKHEGIEASEFAIKISKQRYGFKTFKGYLNDYAKVHKGKGYDVIVLADVLEHVEDPVAELLVIKKLLNPKGVCMIRTPNIDSVEGKVFGNLFYSLKSEHLHYFSPRAISLFAEKAGLSPRFVITQSHFFSGALGEGIRLHEANLLGSDIFALLQKP